MTPPILSAQNITKLFHDPKEIVVLKSINFNVYKGKSAAIIGKSGEGKTTFLHILGTIEEPTSGEIYIHGKKVEDNIRDELRGRHFGFIFQGFHLLSDSTVLENILMPAKIARRRTDKRSEASHRAHDLAVMVGLESRLHFPVTKLSGGEKQRVAIARSFINNPDVIFADEPTGNLDHETAHEVQELLLGAVKEHNKALILVTHNLQLAELLDERYELDGGLLKAM